MPGRLVNPAGDDANVRKLMERVADLERAVRDMRERNYGRRAQITAFTGGSTTLTATFLDGGGTISCHYLQSYSPVLSQIGLVFVTPEFAWFLGRDSVP